MNELEAALKIVVANAVVMYFKAHSYHWNVEGAEFSQYHSFFGDIYADVYNSVDDIAEHIRAIDAYAPISLMDIIGAKTIPEDTAKPVNTRLMVNNLLVANYEMIGCLNKAFERAQSANNQGLMNFLADRLDRHAKHGWMLKASLKTLGA